MPIEDKIKTYSVSIFQTNFQDNFRQIRLNLESGGTAAIQFPAVRPNDWLQFIGADTSLFMTQDQFTDVYHLIQSESPAFFTALEVEGLQVGAVHTQFDLSAGETPGEGDTDPQSLEAIIRRAKKKG